MVYKWTVTEISVVRGSSVRCLLLGKDSQNSSMKLISGVCVYTQQVHVFAWVLRIGLIKIWCKTWNFQRDWSDKICSGDRSVASVRDGRQRFGCHLYSHHISGTHWYIFIYLEMYRNPTLKGSHWQRMAGGVKCKPIKSPLTYVSSLLVHVERHVNNKPPGLALTTAIFCCGHAVCRSEKSLPSLLLTGMLLNFFSGPTMAPWSTPVSGLLPGLSAICCCVVGSRRPPLSRSMYRVVMHVHLFCGQFL
jgi:hypothetical protein